MRELRPKWYYQNPISDEDESALRKMLMVDEPELAGDEWQKLYAAVAAVSAYHRRRAVSGVNSEILKVCAHAADSLSFLSDAVPQLIIQRDAAIEAAKILIGVIQSDVEFHEVESTKQCLDAAELLMHRHSLYLPNTDYIQEDQDEEQKEVGNGNLG